MKAKTENANHILELGFYFEMISTVYIVAFCALLKLTNRTFTEELDYCM